MKKQLFTLIIVMTLITIINNMAHPVTPELVSSLGYGSMLFGVLFATMSLSTFLFSPVWGRLSDQYGRKPFMIISPVGYGLAQIGFGFSTNIYIIVLFRLLAGSFACAVFVCGLAYLIDMTEIKERSKVMGIYTATTGFGANIGYLLGGTFGNRDYHYAFIAQAAFSFLSAILILLVLREAKGPKQVRVKTKLVNDLFKYKNTMLPFMLLITLLSSLLIIGFNNSFNFYLKDHLSFTPFMIGLIMAVTGIIGLVTNIVLYPILKRKFNDFYLLLFSVFVLVVTLTLATYITTINTKIIALIPFFAFLALYKPLLQAIISKLGTNNGEIMGLNNAANAFGNVLGSFYVGWAYALNVKNTFYSLGIVGIIVLILMLFKQNKLKNI